MTDKRIIKTALLSVADKTDIVTFARGLLEHSVQIISTGGTAQVLAQENIPHRLVSEITHFPEIMEGRVKTLHPKIHGGILGKRDAHHDEAREQNIGWIDLVVVNLYPFQATVARGADWDEVIENIDIGGPAMLRAAAKNNDWVTVVHDPADYGRILAELTAGGILKTTRRQLAAKAFTHTAHYDAAISEYLNKEADLFDGHDHIIRLQHQETLRYGENPHQKAILFKTGFGQGIANTPLLQGKNLSYNNLLDAEAALQCVKEFKAPTAVIVKHANPCGVATADDISEAYQKAFNANSQAAFGGIVALNRPCSPSIAEHIASIFMEVVLAPSFDDEALAILSKKPNLRVMALADWDKINTPWLFRSVSGGILVQERDLHQLQRDELNVVTTNKPNNAEVEELLFAWKVVKYLKSNAIAVTKNKTSIGLSGGQVSRIAALKQALQAAEGQLTGAVLASDAFFPFRDSIDAIKDSGIKAIIQPGGSIRDKEVIAACEEYGIAMAFTGFRCFNH